MIPTKPSDTSTRGHSDPMDVDAVNSLSSAKGKGSSSPRDGCFECGGAHFQRDCNSRKGTGKQSYGKGKQSKSWTKSEPSFSDEGKSKENKGQSKGKSKGTKNANKVPKAYTRAKHRKLVSQALKTRSQRQARTFRNLHRHVPLTLPGTMVGMVTKGSEGWSFEEWNDDWSSVGWHEGWEQTYDTSASSLSLGGLEVSATVVRSVLNGGR